MEAVRCVKIQRSREIKYYFMGKETNESSNRISRCYIEGEMRPILCNALKKLVQIRGNWVNVGIKNRCSKIERIYDHLCKIIVTVSIIPYTFSIVRIWISDWKSRSEQKFFPIYLIFHQNYPLKRYYQWLIINYRSTKIIISSKFFFFLFPK